MEVYLLKDKDGADTCPHPHQPLEHLHFDQINEQDFEVQALNTKKILFLWEIKKKKKRARSLDSTIEQVVFCLLATLLSRPHGSASVSSHNNFPIMCSHHIFCYLLDVMTLQVEWHCYGL